MKRSKEESWQAMDNAARLAKSEIPASGSARDLADWWRKWYGDAGHKRLAHVLLDTFQLTPSKR